MSETKPSVKELIERIESHVRPATFPVAVRLLTADDAIPDKARRPQRDLGVQITTCQGVTMARRYGWTVALTREDINCPLTKWRSDWRRNPHTSAKDIAAPACTRRPL